MAERRADAKSRRMGSSRRRQLREGPGDPPATAPPEPPATAPPDPPATAPPEPPAPGPSEEPPCAPEIARRVQDFFREQDKDRTGFVARSDVQKLQEGFQCSTEELELVFDGLDAAGTGRLSMEELAAGLGQFLSSQRVSREHRRRKTASRRSRLVLPSPGVESEEQRTFATCMDQLGMDNLSEEEEIQQLWVKVQEEEPQTLGNPEDFLSKMRHRIQETRSKKEALEVTLNKPMAEHDRKEQQLCEQQIQQDQQQNVARSPQAGVELQLGVSRREEQHGVPVQEELETQCHSLHSTQQATSTKHWVLEESNGVLEGHPQHLQQQLHQTHGHGWTARAVVPWEHPEEPREPEVAELPETPTSSQVSLEKSENHPELWTRLGSRSREPKAKSTHQMIWEMLPAETSLLGVGSTDQDPSPEPLREGHLPDRSSLLREMNDAIAALSKQLQPQLLNSPPRLADTAHRPRDGPEPQTGLEAATAPGTALGVLQETIPGHELLGGDLKEGAATAEPQAPDVAQAGASVGAGHHRAQDPGAEQGESPEGGQRMLFLQEKGAAVKELMLKVAEHLQGAPGGSMEAGEQALMEVEGEGWMQDETGWEKAQPPGEAEEAAVNQGENLEAGLEPPEAGEECPGVGQQVATGELGLAVAAGAHGQPVGVGEEADPPPRPSEKPQLKPGEHPEPEPPPRGEAEMGAAQRADVLPRVTVAPGPRVLEDERGGVEGETSEVRQEWGGGSRGEEGQQGGTWGREGSQPWGESARGAVAAWGGQVGTEEPMPAAVPAASTQAGGVGPDVQQLEAQSSSTDLQLFAEVGAALQPPGEAGSPGSEQGGGCVAPDVQLQEEEEDKLGLGEGMGAARLQGEGPSLAESPVGSPGLGGMLPVKARALEMVEAEDGQAATQMWGGLSPETPPGGAGGAAVELEEEAEDGAEGQERGELPQEPVLDWQGAGVGQGEGAGAALQPGEEAEILDVLEGQGTAADVQLLAEVDEVELTPGGSTEADLHPLSASNSLDMEQEGSIAQDVQALDQVDKAEAVALGAEDSWADTELRGVASPGTPRGGEHCAAIQLEEKAEDGAEGQERGELPQEPVLDWQGAGVGQGEGAGAALQPGEEAEILDVLEGQSTAADVQLLAEVDEVELTPGGSTGADLPPLGAAGLWEGEQSQPPGSEAALCAASATGPREGAAGARLSPLAEVTLQPACATAAEGPALGAKLGALAGPDGQILEDAQTLEIAQREQAAAEERPLEGAQGLGLVQGERLEAGMGGLVEPQGLGRKQGRDEGVSELPPLVSEVTFQISTLKLEMMKQEDVLVPDVQQLGASGQAAQRELQEQVSAQADKMMLPTASQQPEEKPPHVMEAEQITAGLAEPPKLELPPASTLHTSVPEEEDAGNDLSGVVLGDSSLVAAANSSMQPQSQLLGEQSKDLNVGQQEQQQAGQKSSQEGKSNPGKPGAMTAGGAGATPRVSPGASLEPDHLYNVLFVGDSNVGKTSFLYRLHTDTFNPQLTATVGVDYQIKTFLVDNKRFALRLWDSAGQERYRSLTRQLFRRAEGVVLMYDVSSQSSFSDVCYWLSCIQEGAEDGVTILLLGNKTDCAAERQVPTKEGERLAKEHQLLFYECSAASGHNVSESMVSLVRLLKDREDTFKNEVEEIPKPPQKKNGCCW